MKIICAWCKKVMKDGDEKNISHGICETCEAELLKQIEKEKK